MNQDTYLEYWGLDKSPFQNLPDPDMLYFSVQHQKALFNLFFSIKDGKGAVMLIGKTGTGKTFLSRVLVRFLPPSKFEFSMVVNPRLDSTDLLKEILLQFNRSIETANKSALLDELNTTIYQNAEKGKHSILILDEAHSVNNKESLEELRLLLNFQLNTYFPFTLILIGQPELIDKIIGFPELDQRIASKFQIQPLDYNDTVKYLFFRLRRSNLNRLIFTEDAVERIYALSEGIPRAINNICSQSLLTGFINRHNIIDARLVDISQEEVHATAE